MKPIRIERADNRGGFVVVYSKGKGRRTVEFRRSKAEALAYAKLIQDEWGGPDHAKVEDRTGK